MMDEEENRKFGKLQASLDAIFEQLNFQGEYSLGLASEPGLLQTGDGGIYQLEVVDNKYKMFQVIREPSEEFAWKDEEII